MTPERWQEVKKVLAGALERAPEERGAYLDQACPEPVLRREVQSLIDAHEQAETTFMGRPFVGAGETLKSGTRLGPYEILARIGAGGMGVVYRARDGRLEREVAIKVLSWGLLTDEIARKRFRKEALALAKLNHPNIATVHDVGEQGGTDYLVMECVPGLPLAERLKSGALNEKEISSLGAQIAAGLGEAHEQGVIHRDLKPGNVMVTPKGQAKVLDFGLAKLLLPFDAATTQTFAESQTLVGTLPYMAPEQLQGEAVDARTDIHALGLVLYEMASGRRLFQQDSIPQLTDAILHQPPVTPRAFNARVSPELERIILKCLEKEPENRYQSAKELGVDLRRLSSPSTVTTAVTARAEASRCRPRWVAFAGGVAFIAAAAAVGGYFYFHRAPKLTEKDSIVVGDFTNTTGDPVFDGTLRQGLSVQLQQTPFLRLVSDSQIAQTLRLMEKPPDTRLTKDVAREVCQRANAAIEIDGSIGALGSQYVLGLDAVNCHTGDTLAQEQVTADGKEKVLAVLGNAASELRSKLGESRASLQAHDLPMDQITTSSLPALQSWELGVQAFYVKLDFPSAISFWERAVDIDPNFVQAYSALGAAYANVGQVNLAAKYTTKGYELRDRTSEREKLSIISDYHFFATGDWEKATQATEQWAKLYPRDPPAYTVLAGAYGGLGRLDESLEAAREAVRLDPTTYNYGNLVGAYLALNRFDEARATIQQAEARHIDPAAFRSNLYLIAFLENNLSAMERYQLGDQAQSWTAAYYGHLVRSRALTERAVASFKQQGASTLAASAQICGALIEAMYGNLLEARKAAAKAGDFSEDWALEADAAMVFALASDTAQAQKLADDVAKRLPEATYLRFGALPAIRGLLALHRGTQREANETLAAISSHEMLSPWNSSLPPMVPTYIRGGVYLAEGQGAQAAEDFQLILDHPSIPAPFPILALARLGLGRAYALEGDKTKAKAAYQDFLTLWKDADPDMPVLKQAQIEYAKLR